MATALTCAVFGCAVSTLHAQTGNGYDLAWNTIDSGGHMFSTGNGYELGGTIGQSDAGALIGVGGYVLEGGFWPAPAACVCQLYGDIVQSCEVDVSDLIYILDAFADANPAVNFPAADISPCEGNGTVDVDDLIALLAAFGGEFFCPHPCPQ